jgi:hypothetical protein
MEGAEKKLSKQKILFKVCHCCGHCHETEVEPERCAKCAKAFLPLQYFEKVHQSKTARYQSLFEASDELEEESLIKGLYVLW